MARGKRTPASSKAATSTTTTAAATTNNTAAGAQGASGPMSLRSCALRLLLAALLSSILLLGDGLHLRNPDNDYQEDHPTKFLLSLLNTIFKSSGWLITALSWTFLLAARYSRQIQLQENASWRRHAMLDAVLWALASVYWKSCLYLFRSVAASVGDCRLASSLVHAEWDQKTCELASGTWIPFDISGHAFLCTLGICLLLEESIRYIGEPTFYFTFHPSNWSNTPNSTIQRVQRIWWTAVAVSLCVVSTWSLVLLRTAFFYHSLQEKLWGAIIGTAYWCFVVVVRFVLLYSVVPP